MGLLVKPDGFIVTWRKENKTHKKFQMINSINLIFCNIICSKTKKNEIFKRIKWNLFYK